MAEHVRVRPGCLYPAGLGQVAQTPGGGVPVHPGTAVVELNRATSARADRLVDRPADRGCQWDQDDLGALAAHAQHPVASKIRSPSSPSMATSAKSHGRGESRAVVS